MPAPDVIYCSVLVKKCPGAYSTEWRYIVHVINSNCSLFREILLESVEVGQSVTPDSQFLYTGTRTKENPSNNQEGK